MNRATDAISADVAHRQRLGHDALAGECRISVDQHRQNAECSRRFDLVLLRAHHAHHHRPDGFKVAGVRCQFDGYVRTRRADVVAFDTEVILNVARTLN